MKSLFLAMSMVLTGTAAMADGAPAAGAQGSPLGAFLPLVLFVVVFYFFILRPQKKRQKAHDSLVSALAKGDKVVTAGGIFGVVDYVKDDSVVLNVSQNGTKIRVLKGSISQKIADLPVVEKAADKPEVTEVTDAPKQDA